MSTTSVMVILLIIFIISALMLVNVYRHTTSHIVGSSVLSGKKIVFNGIGTVVGFHRYGEFKSNKTLITDNSISFDDVKITIYNNTYMQFTRWVNGYMRFISQSEDYVTYKISFPREVNVNIIIRGVNEDYKRISKTRSIELEVRGYNDITITWSFIK